VALKTDIAWAAGLFEGEGSITARSYETKKYGLTYQIAMELVSSDLDVIEKFLRIVNCGAVHPYNKGIKGTLPHHKQCYCWGLTNRSEIRRILDSFMPYLGMRRMMKAKEVLGHMDEFDTRRRGQEWNPAWH
jgi:hypothetical protein